MDFNIKIGPNNLSLLCLMKNFLRDFFKSDRKQKRTRQRRNVKCRKLRDFRGFVGGTFSATTLCTDI